MSRQKTLPSNSSQYFCQLALFTVTSSIFDSDSKFLKQLKSFFRKVKGTSANFCGNSFSYESTHSMSLARTVIEFFD